MNRAAHFNLGLPSTLPILTCVEAHRFHPGSCCREAEMQHKLGGTAIPFEIMTFRLYICSLEDF